MTRQTIDTFFGKFFGEFRIILDGRLRREIERAILDPQLSLALKAIHEELDRDWTLTSLAKRAHMSRTQFARRFKDTLQQTPIQYLINWRLSTARQLLRVTDLAITDIASRSGYRSVPSFTRRFKKRFNITPAAYRRAGQVETAA